MRPKQPKNRDLPPRMIRRTRKLKGGKLWVGYYYDGRGEDGKRKEIPLGTDLDLAKLEWARLDASPAPKTLRKWGDVFDRYEKEIIPGKAPRTQKDNLLSLTQLRKAFSEAPVEALTPQVLAQYRDKRSAKVRANRELSLFSHIFNIAREWGIVTTENPVKGVRKNRETPRDFYARAEVWNAVYGAAPPELRDAMDLAYLTAQRPSDVLIIREADIQDGHLQIAHAT
uniref:phage integrase n=1 Tax=Pseudomonas aeruginosa TaxID=287 RepID=UPI003D32FBEB